MPARASRCARPSFMFKLDARGLRSVPQRTSRFVRSSSAAPSTAAQFSQRGQHAKALLACGINDDRQTPDTDNADQGLVRDEEDRAAVAVRSDCYRRLPRVGSPPLTLRTDRLPSDASPLMPARCVPRNPFRSWASRLRYASIAAAAPRGSMSQRWIKCLQSSHLSTARGRPSDTGTSSATTTLHIVSSSDVRCRRWACPSTTTQPRYMYHRAPCPPIRLHASDWYAGSTQHRCVPVDLVNAINSSGADYGHAANHPMSGNYDKQGVEGSLKAGVVRAKSAAREQHYRQHLKPYTINSSPSCTTTYKPPGRKRSRESMY